MNCQAIRNYSQVCRSELIKVFDRDLAAASIAKRDDRGRTVDVHALRHTYGSLLSAGGVTPRTAQAAMRHSSIDLTMNVYTDPRVLDIAGALECLPALPLDAIAEHSPSGMLPRGLRGPCQINPFPESRCTNCCTKF